MSKVHGGTKCVKYLLFIFNFIFWLSGSMVLAVGLWLRFDPNTTALLREDGAPGTFFYAVYILMGSGGIMMIVGFFGCWGAVRESQCLLGLFFSSLLIIFGAEVAAGVFGLMNKAQIITEVQSFYNASFTKNGTSTEITSKFHTILSCCKDSGVKSDTSQCSSQTTAKNCSRVIETFFNEKLLIIGYVGIGIAGIMIIGMIFSMVLCCGIRSSREVI